MKYVLAVTVENHAGVLSRISGLFTRRGFNIDSLAVGVTENPQISRITIVMDGDEHTVDQLTKQLNKQLDVIRVWRMGQNSVERELAMIKVSATSKNRQAIMSVADVFRADVVDLSPGSITLELTGGNDKITAMASLLDEFGILEIVRTGIIAIDRG